MTYTEVKNLYKGAMVQYYDYRTKEWTTRFVHEPWNKKWKCICLSGRGEFMFHHSTSVFDIGLLRSADHPIL